MCPMAIQVPHHVTHRCSGHHQVMICVAKQRSQCGQWRLRSAERLMGLRLKMRGSCSSLLRHSACIRSVKRGGSNKMQNSHKRSPPLKRRSHKPPGTWLRRPVRLQPALHLKPALHTQALASYPCLPRHEQGTITAPSHLFQTTCPDICRISTGINPLSLGHFAIC